MKEFNKLTAETFAAWLAPTKFASKSDIANFVKKADFDDKVKKLNKKVTSNKSKHLLVENELQKLQTFDSSLFIGQSYFFSDGVQLYLIFQLLYYTFKTLSNSEKVTSWKSKGWSAEKLTTSTTIDNILSPTIKLHDDSKFCLVFKRSCLKQKNAIFYTPSNRINFFIAYELDAWSRNLNSDFTLKKCLFEGVKLAKNADPQSWP